MKQHLALEKHFVLMGFFDKVSSKDHLPNSVGRTDKKKIKKEEPGHIITYCVVHCLPLTIRP